MAERIAIEVAYVEPGRQFLQALTVPAGATVGDAIDASELRRNFPELDVDAARVGVFSRPATRETALRDGDRVEVYRALIANPKEVRRQRAVKAGKA